MDLIDSLRIAENVRNLRALNSLTQDDFAVAIGYSRRQIIRIETEGTKNLDTINVIAKFFNVSALSILSN